MRLNLEFSDGLDESLDRKGFKQGLEGLKITIAKAKHIPIFFAGSRPAPRTGEPTDIFSLELSPQGPFLAFKFDRYSKNIWVFDAYGSSSSFNSQVGLLESLQMTKDNCENSSLYDSIYENLRVDQGANISTGQLYHRWQKFLDIEERILIKVKEESVKIRILSVMSNAPDKFIVKIASPGFDIASKFESEFILSNEDGDTKNFKIIDLVAPDRLHIHHKNPESYEKVTAESILKEDFSGRAAEFNRKNNAFKKLMKDEASNIDLKALLVNPGAISDTKHTFVINNWFDPNLGPDSQTVVKQALTASSIYLIQGPPGTGKTTTIAEICNQVTSKNMRVLIAGQTNMSIDNVIEKMVERDIDAHGKILRIGKYDKITMDDARKCHMENKKDNFFKESAESVNDFIKIIEEKLKLDITCDEVKALEDFPALKAKIDSLTQIENSLIEKIAQKRVLYNELKKNIAPSKALYKFFSLFDMDEENCQLVIHHLVGQINLVSVLDYLRLRKTEIELKQGLSEAREKLPRLLKEMEHVGQDLDLIPELEILLAKKKTANFILSWFSESEKSLTQKINQLRSKQKKIETLKIEVLLHNTALEEYNQFFPSISVKLSSLALHEKDLDYLSNRLGKYQALVKFLKEENEVEKILSTLATSDAFKLFQEMNELKKTFNAISEFETSMNQLINGLNNLRASIAESDRIRIAISSLLNPVMAYFRENLETISTERYQEIVDYITDAKIWKPAISLKESYANFSKDIKIFGHRDDRLVEEFMLSEATVIVATCSQSASPEFQALPGDFDYVIIDEAAKALPTELFIPLIHGKKIILVGDHKQLMPHIDDDVLSQLDYTEREFIQNPLFGELFEKAPLGCKTMLKTQYRMPLRLAQIVSELFYEGKLDSGPNVSKAENPVSFYNVDGKETKRGTSYINEDEVQAVLRFLKHFSMTPANYKKSIGVISLYLKQSQLLENEVLSKFSRLNISFGTVDSFQGREKDIIILSTVRSTRLSSFVSLPNRINVSISRAKEQLVIFGNEEVLLKDNIYQRILGRVICKKAA